MFLWEEKKQTTFLRLNIVAIITSPLYTLAIPDFLLYIDNIGYFLYCIGTYFGVAVLFRRNNAFCTVLEDTPSLLLHIMFYHQIYENMLIIIISLFSLPSGSIMCTCTFLIILLHSRCRQTICRCARSIVTVGFTS